MSLLDDVSIVVTPNGYKAGELYAVVPVPTEGAEEVVNGDFATETVWTFSGTTFSAGAVLFNSTNDYVFQNWTDIVNTIYKLTITKTGLGTFQFRSGFSGSAATKIDIPESGIIYFTSTSNTNRIQIYGKNNVSATLNSVSVKKWTGADMDVTRATAATRVDENGLVNYAEVLGDSALTGNNSNFDTGIGSWVGYSGGSVSHSTDKLEVTLTSTQSGARINTNSLISGGQIGKTFKVRAKIWKGTSTNATIPIYMGGSQKVITISSTPTYFEVELTPSNTGYLTIYRASGAGGVGTFFIDDVTVKESTRDNVPRIDYTGGGCPHILAEPQRTNLITYSEDFTDSSWTKQSNITLTSNTTETLSPDGTNNSTKLVGNGSDGVYKAGVSVTGVIARSVYLKSVTGTVNVILKDPNATITSKSLSVTTEWKRFELSEDNGTSLQGLWVDDIPASGIYIWGAQLEEGSYSTSYITTSGSTVTRNQDVFTRNGIGSLINSTEGVLFAEWKPKLSSDYSLLSINNGTSAETVTIGKSNNTTNMFLGVRHLGGYEIIYTSASHDLTIFNKVAVKWKAGDYAIWVNGVEVLTSTSATIPTGMNKLSFDFGDGGFDFYGEIKQLQVYKTALTDNQLIQLTGEAGTHFFESYAEMASALTYTIQ